MPVIEKCQRTSQNVENKFFNPYKIIGVVAHWGIPKILQNFFCKMILNDYKKGLPSPICQKSNIVVKK